MSGNRLGEETSPYLLQHRDNPVHWLAWNDASLEIARTGNKPILLSIGYSACHWCHVMAHESFEDPATAELMNRLYINIKVDREERPDLDRIYQRAHQMFNQRPGGWPLTVFLDPQDHVPFFVGTYFPCEARFGMPPFAEILTRAEAFFRDHPEDIRRQAESLRAAYARLDRGAPAPAEALNDQPIAEALGQLRQGFDPRHGGFGGAPKFPHPGNLELLLRGVRRTRAGAADDELAHALHHTLQRMALGGLYDQIGGGFCRYSVDAQWMIPHFEKMLYDNGQLLAIYSRAWRISGEPLYRQVCEETAVWAIREMQSPDGGYWSSLDADSEGEEGRFYTWTPAELAACLDAEDRELVSALYGLDRPANFEGRWHLHVPTDYPQVAARLGIDTATLLQRLPDLKARLYDARARRVHPGCDDKILTSWNGLMIRGMAIAGRDLERDDWLDAAATAIRYLRETCWRDGRLFASSKHGRAALNAYLDDYAFLIDAILCYAQARWDTGLFAFAIELADALLERFEDPDEGGFFFTSHDHEALLQRPKTLEDEAIPSGSGIATSALLRLGHILGDTRYLDAAERALRQAWDSVQQMPVAHTAFLEALDLYLAPPRIVVIRGEPEVLTEWHRTCEQIPSRELVCLAIPADAGAGLPGALAERRAEDGPVAYVCEGFQCRAPIRDLETLLQAF